MTDQTHRDRAEDYLRRATAWIEGENAGIAALIGTGYAVLAHLDALALPEPGTGDVILDAARKLTDELGPNPDFHVRAFAEAVQDHDHGGLTSGSDDHAQHHENPAPSVAGATNPGVPVSLDAGNGRSQIRAGLIDRLVEVLSARQNLGIVATAGVQHYSLDDQSVYRLAGDVATALLEDGWRPPLPDVDGPELDEDDESPVALAASYLAPFIGGPTHRRIDLAVARGLNNLGLLAKPLPGGGQALAEHVAGAIADALAVHRWDGGDHSNHPLSTFAEVATAAVMPFLDEPSPDEIALIAAERRRVVDVEGRTPEGDDGYVHGQLVYAAAAYLGETVGAPACLRPGQLWPWAYEGFKPGDALTNLVKAGQLIAAEIARLQRTQARAECEQSTVEPEHADDCTGCDGPGIVPCAADRVIGNTAFRNGQPIKDLEADRG
ncbi:hypothetical protein DMC63_01455 [Streptomyces sp. WAC 05977]|nr:hypothetical protein DMC63_01455 [Streptomyces sp. WAC 05977]